MLNLLHAPDPDGLDHLLYPDADDGWLELFECRHERLIYVATGTTDIMGRPQYRLAPDPAHEQEHRAFEAAQREHEEKVRQAAAEREREREERERQEREAREASERAEQARQERERQEREAREASERAEQARRERLAAERREREARTAAERAAAEQAAQEAAQREQTAIQQQQAAEQAAHEAAQREQTAIQQQEAAPQAVQPASQGEQRPVTQQQAASLQEYGEPVREELDERDARRGSQQGSGALPAQPGSLLQGLLAKQQAGTITDRELATLQQIQGQADAEPPPGGTWADNLLAEVEAGMSGPAEGEEAALATEAPRVGDRSNVPDVERLAGRVVEGETDGVELSEFAIGDEPSRDVLQVAMPGDRSNVPDVQRLAGKVVEGETDGVELSESVIGDEPSRDVLQVAMPGDRSNVPDVQRLAGKVVEGETDGVELSESVIGAEPSRDVLGVARVGDRANVPDVQRLADRVVDGDMGGVELSESAIGTQAANQAASALAGPPQDGSQPTPVPPSPADAAGADPSMEALQREGLRLHDYWRAQRRERDGVTEEEQQAQLDAAIQSAVAFLRRRQSDPDYEYYNPDQEVTLDTLTASVSNRIAGPSALDAELSRGANPIRVEVARALQAGRHGEDLAALAEGYTEADMGADVLRRYASLRRRADALSAGSASSAGEEGGGFNPQDWAYNSDQGTVVYDPADGAQLGQPPTVLPPGVEPDGQWAYNSDQETWIYEPPNTVAPASGASEVIFGPATGAPPTPTPVDAADPADGMEELQREGLRLHDYWRAQRRERDGVTEEEQQAQLDAAIQSAVAFLRRRQSDPDYEYYNPDQEVTLDTLTASVSNRIAGPGALDAELSRGANPMRVEVARALQAGRHGEDLAALAADYTNADMGADVLRRYASLREQADALSAGSAGEGGEAASATGAQFVASPPPPSPRGAQEATALGPDAPLPSTPSNPLLGVSEPTRPVPVVGEEPVADADGSMEELQREGLRLHDYWRAQRRERDGVTEEEQQAELDAAIQSAVAFLRRRQSDPDYEYYNPDQEVTLDTLTASVSNRIAGPGALDAELSRGANPMRVEVARALQAGRHGEDLAALAADYTNADMGADVLRRYASLRRRADALAAGSAGEEAAGYNPRDWAYNSDQGTLVYDPADGAQLGQPPTVLPQGVEPDGQWAYNSDQGTWIYEPPNSVAPASGASPVDIGEPAPLPSPSTPSNPFTGEPPPEGSPDGSPGNPFAGTVPNADGSPANPFTTATLSPHARLRELRRQRPATEDAQGEYIEGSLADRARWQREVDQLRTEIALAEVTAREEEQTITFRMGSYGAETFTVRPGETVADVMARRDAALQALIDDDDPGPSGGGGGEREYTVANDGTVSYTEGGNTYTVSDEDLARDVREASETGDASGLSTVDQVSVSDESGNVVTDNFTPTVETDDAQPEFSRENIAQARADLLAQAAAMGIGYDPNRPDYDAVYGAVTEQVNAQNRDYVNHYLPGTVAPGQVPTQQQISAAGVVASDIASLGRTSAPSQARVMADYNARVATQNVELLESHGIDTSEMTDAEIAALVPDVYASSQRRYEREMLPIIQQSGILEGVDTEGMTQAEIVAQYGEQAAQTVGQDFDRDQRRYEREMLPIIQQSGILEGVDTEGMTQAEIVAQYGEQAVQTVGQDFDRDQRRYEREMLPIIERSGILDGVDTEGMTQAEIVAQYGEQAAQIVGQDFDRDQRRAAIAETDYAVALEDATTPFYEGQKQTGLQQQEPDARDLRIEELERSYRSQVAGTMGALGENIGVPETHPNFDEYNRLRTQRDGPNWKREERADKAEAGRDQTTLATVNVGPIWDAGRSVISGRHISQYDGDIPFDINPFDYVPILGTATDAAIRGRDGYSKGDLAWLAGMGLLDVAPIPGVSQVGRVGKAGLMVLRNPTPALSIATGGRRTLQSWTQGTLKAPYEISGTRIKKQGVANIPVRLGDDVIIDGRRMPAWEGLLYQRDKALAQYRLTGKPQTIQVPTADGGLQSVVVGGSRAATSYGTGGMVHTSNVAGLLTELSQTPEGFIGKLKYNKRGQLMPDVENQHFMTTQGVPAFLETNAFKTVTSADPNFSPGFQTLTDPRNLADVEDIRKVFGGDVDTGVMGQSAVVELEGGIPQAKVIAGGPDKPALYAERPVGLQKVGGETLYAHVDVAPDNQLGRLPVLRDNILAAIDNARGRTDTFYVTRTNADGTTEVARATDLDALRKQGINPEDALRIRTASGETRLISRAEWERVAQRVGGASNGGQATNDNRVIRGEEVADDYSGTPRRDSNFSGRNGSNRGDHSGVAAWRPGSDYRAPVTPTPEDRLPVPGTGTVPEDRLPVPGTGTVPEDRLPVPGTGTVPEDRLPVPGTGTVPEDRLPVPGTGTVPEDRLPVPGTGTVPEDRLPVPGTGTVPEDRLPVPGTGTVPEDRLPVPGTGTVPEDRLPVPGTGTVPEDRLPVPGTGTTPEDRLPVPGTGTVPEDRLPVPGTGTTPEDGLPVPGTGTVPEDRLPVPGTGTTPEDGLPVPGTGTVPEDRLPVPGTGITPEDGLPVPGTGTVPEDRLPVPGTGITPEDGLPVPGTGITPISPTRPRLPDAPERRESGGSAGTPPAGKRRNPRPSDEGQDQPRKIIGQPEKYPDKLTWDTHARHTYDFATGEHSSLAIDNTDYDSLRAIGWTAAPPRAVDSKVGNLRFITDGRSGDYQAEPVRVRAVDLQTSGISNDSGYADPDSRRQLTEAGVTPRKMTWLTRTRQTWDPRTGEQVSETLTDDNVTSLEILGTMTETPALSNARVGNLEIVSGADGVAVLTIPRRTMITPVGAISEIEASDPFGGARAGAQRPEIPATPLSSSPQRSGAAEASSQSQGADATSEGSRYDRIMDFMRNRAPQTETRPTSGRPFKGKRGRRTPARPQDEILTEMEGQTSVAPPPVLVMR